MKILSVILLFMIAFNYVKAEERDIKEILDEKIDKFCLAHEKANWQAFTWVLNSTRCRNILKPIYRFETGQLKSYVWNNIFNFRSPTIKKIWTEKYGVTEIRWWFLVFPDRTKSIEFAVDRFYLYDYRKTIEQIIAWWCMYNLKWKYVCFKGYTLTSSHWESYINYITKFAK